MLCASEGRGSSLTLGKTMNSGFPFALFAILFTTGCGWVPYTHPVVAERNGVEVVERSREFKSPHGEAVSRAMTGLPIKSVIKRAGYIIEIRTPVNAPAPPVMFLRASSIAGDELYLKGNHLYGLDKRSGGWISGDRYTFYLGDAKGRPLVLEVITPAGSVIGQERIEYDVEIRKRVWVFDGL
jgi:hypothetical protein